MINYILKVYIHKPESSCWLGGSGGRVLGRIYTREGYDKAFDACYKNRRCGCIDTCNGYVYGGDWYDIYATSTTKDNPGSNACHSWVKKTLYFAEG